MDDLERILAVEEIKQLKYRYLRHLDCKEWDALAELFAEDATSSYGDGKYSFAGREAIMGFLRGALGRPTILTAHHVHHPEIALTSPSAATGVWALQDVVIDLRSGVTIRGAAFYRDEYAKGDGVWRIHSTGYRRTYEEMEPRPADGPVKLTANRFAGLCDTPS